MASPHPHSPLGCPALKASLTAGRQLGRAARLAHFPSWVLELSGILNFGILIRLLSTGEALRLGHTWCLLSIQRLAKFGSCAIRVYPVSLAERKILFFCYLETERFEKSNVIFKIQGRGSQKVEGLLSLYEYQLCIKTGLVTL